MNSFSSRRRTMQIEMREGTEEGLELNAVEGSHLYVRSASGSEVFLEWDELSEEMKKEALKLSQRAAEMRGAVDGLYWRVVEASA